MQAAFSVRRLRYRFRAQDTITFGAPGAANGIRGKLGWNLHLDEDAYARLFRPVRAGTGPSGLADGLRPFVLRASHLDDRRLQAGEEFSFDVHLFKRGENALEAMRSLDAAFGKMAEIISVDAKDVRIDLAAALPDIARMRVDFVTPTELKSGGELAARPEFSILFARARDRVATLGALYGEGVLDVDFARLGERARHVVIDAVELQQVERTRRSSRTGQVHSIGGFTGYAIYSGGSLAEFWPWLEAAEWTGVGRQTVWGKGQIRLTKL